MTNNEILKAIESSCSIEVAVQLAGITLKRSPRGRAPATLKSGAYLSPFRSEKQPSFSIWQHHKTGSWLFHDKATGDKGNVIQLVAKGRGITYAEAAELIDTHLGLGKWIKPKRNEATAFKPRKFENVDTRPPELFTVSEIATGLGLCSAEGVRRLIDVGLLHVGDYWNVGRPRDFQQKDCWFLLDPKAKAATARRISGKPIGRLKSSMPKGWHKRPIGLSFYDSNRHTTAIIAEGEKDLCAIMSGTSSSTSLPVCMPSTATTIQGAVFPKVERVIIFAQADAAGIEAAKSWSNWVTGSVDHVAVWVPKKHGADWADIFGEMESEQIDEAMHLKHAFRVYTDEAIQALNPRKFPTAKSHLRESKQRGSDVNVERIKAIQSAQQTLPAAQRESPSHLCRAMGWEVKGANLTKITRSLKIIRKRGLDNNGTKTKKRVNTNYDDAGSIVRLSDNGLDAFTSH